MVKEYQDIWLKWLDSPIKCKNLLHNYPIRYYTKCEFSFLPNGRTITLSVGDFVRLNTSIAGDAARICELIDNPNKNNRYHAKVDWFSPFSTITQNKPIDVDDNEVFLDTRYGNDIDLSSIIELTSVSSDRQPNSLLCRYRMVEYKPRSRTYHFVQYRISDDILNIENEENAQLPQMKARKSLRTPSRHPNYIEIVDSDSDESPSKKSKFNNIHMPAEWSPSVVLKNLRIQSTTQTPRALRELNDDMRQLQLASNGKAKQQVSPLKIVKKSNEWQTVQTPKSRSEENHDESLNKRSKVTPRRQLFEDKSNGQNDNAIKIHSEENNEESVNCLRRSTRRKTQCDLMNNLETFCTPIKTHLTAILAGTPKGILKTPGSQKIGTPKRRAVISENVQKISVSPSRSPEKLDERRLGTRPKAEIVIETSDDEYMPVTPKSDRKRRTSRVTSATPKKSEKSLKTKIRLSNIRPSIADRATAVEKRTLDIQIARGRLQVSEVPESLPCRETEFNAIYTFVEGKIIDQSGGCIYISGVPGTGKTATVTAAIRSLQKQAQHRKLPTFEYVELNAMQLTEPRRAYVHIYRELTGKIVPWEEARTLLEHRFTSSSGKRKQTTVLLVDELDILCNRRQDVVYNILDWPTKKSAQLVVITIANTMDLPERVLIGKVASRLGLTRLTFQPYSYKQLQEVIVCRLSGTESYKSEAVQLVARKVASVSGDCRRALDICRRAGEIAEQKSTDPKEALVTMVDVQQALDEMIASPKIRAIQHCSEMEKLFLRCVVAEVTRTGIEEVSFLGVYTQMESIAPLFNMKILPPGQTLVISCGLGDSRLIICEESKADIYQKICLNVSVDDVHYALNMKSI